MKFTKTFIGNHLVYNHLQKQLKNGTVPHANLVVGPMHVGKTTFITNLVYLLLCEKPVSERTVACGRCQVCTMLNNDVHPNVLQVSPNSKQIISITEIRELVYGLRQSSFLRGQRIIVIHEADTMTPSASNALLKVLEEPGRDSTFFLSAPNVDSVLPTIQSRCATIELYPVPTGELAAAFPDSIDVVPYANGLPGTLKGLTKAHSKGLIQDHVYTWIKVIQEPLLNKRLQLAQSVWPDSIKRPKALEQLAILETISRDILLLQNAMVDSIQNTFARNELQSIASSLSVPMTLKSIQTIAEIQRRMRQPIHLKITLTDLLLTIYR